MDVTLDQLQGTWGERSGDRYSAMQFREGDPYTVRAPLHTHVTRRAV